MSKPKKEQIKGQPRSFRLTKELDSEIDRLQHKFGFSSLNEMIENSVKLYRDIDQHLSKIEKRPHNWDDNDWENALFPKEIPGSQGLQRAELIVAWLKTRYGTDFEELWREYIGETQE